MPDSRGGSAPVAGGTDGDTLPTIGGVLRFLRLIWALDHGLQIASKRLEMERGVSGQQRLLLRLLVEHSRLSAGQLAGILHLDPSTVTGIVKRLEQRRLVRRTGDPSDGRRVVVALTDKGRRAATPDERTVEALVERALESFPHTKVEATEEVLRALTSALLMEGRP
jgi:DNA-binding MarR family transcriptional regulator